MQQQSLSPSQGRPTYEEAVRFLESRVNFEKLRQFSAEDMGRRLDRMRELLESFGSPERRYLTLHVAGTKGKGSTCAMLESLLRQAGLRVGLFTSPHLDSFHERFRINGEPCSDSDFADIVFFLRDRIMEEMPELMEMLTFFELTTLFAFEFFARKQVDVAVFEVGMGGRLDATNLCHPDVTLITSIGLDHIDQLGDTIEKIAEEKAGIIKPDVPLASAVRMPQVRSVIRRIAENVGASAYFIDEAFFITRENGLIRFRADETLFPEPGELTFRLPNLPGEHQIHNAALAVAAVLLLKQRHGLSVTDEILRSGLERSYVPIRVEIFRSPDRPTVILDGAHDRSSVKAFVNTIRETFPGVAGDEKSDHPRFTLLFGTTHGKDVRGMLSEVLPVFDRVVFTQYSSVARRLAVEQLQRIAATGFPTKCDRVEIAEDASEAFLRLLSESTESDVLCVTGSMYLAAELRRVYLCFLNGPKPA